MAAHPTRDHAADLHSLTGFVWGLSCSATFALVHHDRSCLPFHQLAPAVANDV